MSVPLLNVAPRGLLVCVEHEAIGLAATPPPTTTSTTMLSAPPSTLALAVAVQPACPTSVSSNTSTCVVHFAWLVARASNARYLVANGVRRLLHLHLHLRRSLFAPPASGQ